MIDTSNPLVIFASILIGFIFIVIVFRASKMPYVACEALLTKSELNFYKTLKRAVSHDDLIMMKVRMGDIITCSDIEWKAGWGPKISAKHIDFVVIDSKTTAVKYGIELDDSTHRTNRDRIERDKFVNKAFDVAGVTLHRIDAKRSYNLERLREELY